MTRSELDMPPCAFRPASAGNPADARAQTCCLCRPDRLPRGAGPRHTRRSAGRLLDWLPRRGRADARAQTGRLPNRLRGEAGLTHASRRVACAFPTAFRGEAGPRHPRARSRAVFSIGFRGEVGPTCASRRAACAVPTGFRGKPGRDTPRGEPGRLLDRLPRGGRADVRAQTGCLCLPDRLPGGAGPRHPARGAGPPARPSPRGAGPPARSSPRGRAAPTRAGRRAAFAPLDRPTGSEGHHATELSGASTNGLPARPECHTDHYVGRGAGPARSGVVARVLSGSLCAQRARARISSTTAVFASAYSCVYCQSRRARSRLVRA